MNLSQIRCFQFQLAVESENYTLQCKMASTFFPMSVFTWRKKEETSLKKKHFSFSNKSQVVFVNSIAVNSAVTSQSRNKFFLRILIKKALSKTWVSKSHANVLILRIWYYIKTMSLIFFLRY